MRKFLGISPQKTKSSASTQPAQAQSQSLHDFYVGGVVHNRNNPVLKPGYYINDQVAALKIIDTTSGTVYYVVQNTVSRLTDPFRQLLFDSQGDLCCRCSVAQQLYMDIDDLQRRVDFQVYPYTHVQGYDFKNHRIFSEMVFDNLQHMTCAADNPMLTMGGAKTRRSVASRPASARKSTKVNSTKRVAANSKSKPSPKPSPKPSHRRA